MALDVGACPASVMQKLAAPPAPHTERFDFFVVGWLACLDFKKEMGGGEGPPRFPGSLWLPPAPSDRPAGWRAPCEVATQ